MLQWPWTKFVNSVIWFVISTVRIGYVGHPLSILSTIHWNEVSSETTGSIYFETMCSKQSKNDPTCISCFSSETELSHEASIQLVDENYLTSFQFQLKDGHHCGALENLFSTSSEPLVQFADTTWVCGQIVDQK